MRNFYSVLATPFGGDLFCDIVLCILSSFAIISRKKNEMVFYFNSGFALSVCVLFNLKVFLL